MIVIIDLHLLCSHKFAELSMEYEPNESKAAWPEQSIGFMLFLCRYWPTAGADATTSAGPPSSSKRGSASEQPTKRQKVQTPQAPTSGEGRAAAAPMTADEQWERKKKPVDLLTMYFYFPFSGRCAHP